MSKEIIEDEEELNPHINLFFEHLWNNIHMQKILFAHRRQIFPDFSEDDMNLRIPFLFWSNLPQNAKKSSLDVLSVQTEFEEMKRTQTIGIMNEYIEEIKNEFEDLAYYYLIKFLRNNQQIIKIAQIDDFSYHYMKKELKNYKNINYDIFNDTDEILSTDSGNESKAIINFDNISKNVKDGIGNNLLDLINSLDFSNIKGGLFLSGYQNIIEFLTKSDIKTKNYENILSELYSLRLLENFGTVFWCSQCLDEPFITHTISNIHPSQYNLKCPKCNKKMYYVSAYTLDETILDYIYDSDGLLKCAFNWLLLNEENIQIENSFYSSKHENDFVISYGGKKYLVEIKMHNTLKDSDSIEEHFIKDLTQIKKHLEGFEEDNIEIKHAGMAEKVNDLIIKNDMVKATLEDFRNKMANIVDAELSNISDIISATIKFLDEKGSTTKEIAREFILGENQYSKEFNKNLTNVKVGDEIETKLFSKNQKIEDKEIGDNIQDRNFLVKINEIKRKILPELNDAFAKDLEYESLIDMKTKIEEELKIKIEKDNNEILKNSILTTLIEKNPFELPSSLINNYAETLAKPYADAYKIDFQKLIPLYAQTAEFNIKSHYILEEIKKTEKVNVSESDKEAMIIEAAKNLKMDMENYKKMYKKQIESEDFKHAIIESKLLKMIEKNSKFIPYPKKENEDNNKDKKNK